LKFEKLNEIVKESIKNSSNRLELWVYLLKKISPKKVCEVGVWTGDFAKYLLDHVDEIQNYYFLDPWRNLPKWNKPANRSNLEFENIRLQAFKKNKKHENKIHELRMTTKEAANKLDNESLDFTYIDGDHTLRGITIDLNVIYPKMKVNSFIGGDDFTKNIWQHSDKYDPTEVFPYAVYYAEAQNCTIFTLPYNQFLIFKNDHFEIIDYGCYAKLNTKEIYYPPLRFKSLKWFITNSARSVLRKFI